MADTIRLGSFLLEEPLSAGGMGTVWRGRHPATDTPVAVKVIAASYARNPVYLDGFEREVRAVARMRHPRIVRVYDFGFVDSAAAKSSNNELPLRAPWLAMEYASRGSLAHLPGIGDWATLKTVLFDVLDALAHSHARNIVHRDLKPGNILLSQSSDEGIRCKLTDFGIAHASGRSMSTREVFASSAGTPWYMAPEQVDSRWRDYGPWTDLYALGCVAYQLASGRTPFVGDSAVRVARQQLFDRPPPLEPQIDAPPGFAAWVERLLAKEIPHRFRRAADAAWALHQLSPRDEKPIRLTLKTGVDPDSVDASDTTRHADSDALELTTDAFTSEIATLTFLDEERDTARIEVPKFTIPGSMLAFSVPPMPSTWGGFGDMSEARLPGAGLGLFRLREPPFVGREEERDQVWNALRDVVTHREPRAIVVEGPAGVGKSRFAEWMSQRGHELGIANTMRAKHSPVRGTSHGLGSMLEAFLGCGGLDFERCYLRIRRLFATNASEPPDVTAYFAAAMTTIIRGSGEASGVPAVRFANQQERYEVVTRVVGHVADRRPVIMLLDDVQWGFDAIGLAERMLDTELPLLIVLTVRRDQLAQRPLEQSALERFTSLENVETLSLGPLSRERHQQLIDELLILEPTLREEVLERTLGSPLFAAELVADWVQRRVLQSGPNGFRLIATEQIPESLSALWNQRLDRTIAQLEAPSAARAAIEVGAALGVTVDIGEWYATCDRLGIDIDPALLDHLTAAGLVEPGEGGWSFRHQMFRESIVDEAHASGRASGQHRMVAEMLEFDESPDNQLRRALHCLAVDDYEGAAPPLSAAVANLYSSGRVQEATSLLSMLRQVVQHLPENHSQHAEWHERNLEFVHRYGDHAGIRDAIEGARALAETHGWDRTLARISLMEGVLAIDSGDAAQGRELLNSALEHAQRSRGPKVIADVHNRMGWFAIRFGKTDEARAHFEAARDHFRMVAHLEGISTSLVGLAETEVAGGNFASARAFLDEAVKICRDEGFRMLLATHLNQMGELASREGNRVEAANHYAEAVRLGEMTHDLQTMAIARLNLGVTQLYFDRPHEAASLLRQATEGFTQLNFRLYRYFAELGLLWTAAALGDAEKWDERFAPLLSEASHDLAERESVEHSVTAGDHWMSLGDARRALQAYELAAELVPVGFQAELEPIIEARVDAAKREVARVPTS